MSQDTVRQRFDHVEVRATKGGTSEVIDLTREAAAIRCVELAAEGWSVEIIELARQTPTDGPGAWAMVAALQARYAELRSRTLRTIEHAGELHRATAVALEAGRLARSGRYQAKLG